MPLGALAASCYDGQGGFTQVTFRGWCGWPKQRCWPTVWTAYDLLGSKSSFQEAQSSKLAISQVRPNILNLWDNKWPSWAKCIRNASKYQFESFKMECTLTSHKNDRCLFHILYFHIFSPHPWLKPCQAMMEILPSGASQSSRSDQRGEGLHCLPALPGEIPEENDVERQAPAAKDHVTLTCTVWNDLKVAAEVDFGHGSHWRIIYPEAKLQLVVDSMGVQPQLSVRLRDDLNVWGICTAVQGSTFRLSSSFGDFGDRVTKHIQQEEAAAEEESRLREERQKEIDQKVGSEVTGAILEKQECAMLVCVLASIFLTEHQSLGLAVVLVLYVCAAQWTPSCWRRLGLGRLHSSVPQGLSCNAMRAGGS